MPKDVSPISPASLSVSERRQLLRLAFRFCWNTQDAEDVLQDALLAAARRADQLRDPGSRWPWLRRIVVQQCRLHGRRRRDSRSLPGRDTSEDAGAQARGLSREELGTLMRRLLVTLPERQRIAMTLRHIEQMDYSSIAEVMHVSESTVRAHVRAGRETLRRLILERHPEWLS